MWCAQATLVFKLGGTYQRRQFNALHFRQLTDRDVIAQLAKLHQHRPTGLRKAGIGKRMINSGAPLAHDHRHAHSSGLRANRSSSVM
jgi:hypothetical protein